MAGEWSETRDANEEIQKICDQDKPHVETITGTINGDFKAVVHKNQTVTEGQNYLIKVQVGEKDYIHLSLFQELDGEVTVRGLLHFTQAIQKICDQVKPQVEEMTGMNYREFKAVKYRAEEFGNNSLFKVHVGGEIGREDYIHLAVSQSDVLQGDVQKINLLNGVQQHKTDDDPLIPFS